MQKQRTLPAFFTSGMIPLVLGGMMGIAGMDERLSTLKLSQCQSSLLFNLRKGGCQAHCQ